MKIYCTYQTEEVQVVTNLEWWWPGLTNLSLFLPTVNFKGPTERETALYKIELQLSSVSITDVLHSNYLLSLLLFAHVDLALTSLPVQSSQSRFVLHYYSLYHTSRIQLNCETLLDSMAAVASPAELQLWMQKLSLHLSQLLGPISNILNSAGAWVHLYYQYVTWMDRW